MNRKGGQDRGYDDDDSDDDDDVNDCVGRILS